MMFGDVTIQVNTCPGNLCHARDMHVQDELHSNTSNTCRTSVYHGTTRTILLLPPNFPFLCSS